MFVLKLKAINLRGPFIFYLYFSFVLLIKCFFVYALSLYLFPNTFPLQPHDYIFYIFYQIYLFIILDLGSTQPSLFTSNYIQSQLKAYACQA